MESIIQKSIEQQKDFYQSGVTKRLSYRLKQLERLSKAIVANEDKITVALKADLGKSDYEVMTTEIGFTLTEIAHLKQHLKSYMQPKRVKCSLIHVGSKAYVLKEPYGQTLIIAPWNYPFQLAIAPLAAAIAAGNTVVLKPSEMTPHTAQVIEDLVKATFKPNVCTVIQGGIEVSQALLDSRFDKIFFTGSPQVGKIVMEKAAKHLTPVTLELGGKSPCIVHETAPIKLAVKRILFGKATNAGQTCIAPDYVLIHESVEKAFCETFKKELNAMYGSDLMNNPAYGRIVNEKHLNRLVTYLNDGEVLLGGGYDKAQLHMDVTLLKVKDLKTSVMQEEIFGPVLPIITYKDEAEIYALVAKQPDPLALYVFTKDKSFAKRILNRIPFGGGCINDTIMHVAHNHLPFGGRGNSGMGCYHGKYSFEAFTHEKSILHSPTVFDLKLKYPPFKEKHKKVLRWLLYK